MAADQPVVVPLVEQLRSIPPDAILRIDTPNALGCMDTQSIPVGRLCQEAADALGVAASGASEMERLRQVMRGALYHLRDTRSGFVTRAIEALEAEVGTGGVLPADVLVPDGSQR